jgi:hypothetical protein
MCIILYDERVNTYHRLQDIDTLIDEKPELSSELIDLDIRNQQAHRELQTYNDTKKFANEHQLVIDFNIRKTALSDLKFLRKTSPQKFLNEITNLQQNIRRVESKINTKKYKSDEELKTWTENLNRLKIKRDLIADIISE